MRGGLQQAMAHIPVGDTWLQVEPVPVHDFDRFLLYPFLRDYYEEGAVHHRGLERVICDRADKDNALLVYLIVSGIFHAQEREGEVELQVQSPSYFPGGEGRISSKSLSLFINQYVPSLRPGGVPTTPEILSRVLGKYVTYLHKDCLGRDPVRVRTINGFPLVPSSASSLEETLVTAFENRAEVAGKVLSAVQDEISHLQLITSTSMAGMRGGVVGNYHLVGGSSVVFKVETDFGAAYKSTRAPYLIHHHASENQLTARLARRIPKPLTAFPIQQGAYWISLADDFSEKRILATTEDLRVMDSELQRGLQYTVVEALYLAALYQEVMGVITAASPEPFLHMKSTIPSNLSGEEIRARLRYDTAISAQIRPVVEPLLAGVGERNACLVEMAPCRQELVHGDFKSIHRIHGQILDTGSSRQDTVAVDLGRVFMDQPEVFNSLQMFEEYVDSFVRMRQRLNSQYEPPSTLHRATLFQTMNDALRNLGWDIIQGTHQNLTAYLTVAGRINSLVSL